ncbi:BQ5605_C004g02774 [Microbotryum silenes-dioicae]|uniref:BQ5605_C004g02774 protein n=1 Tax=Microbotryum silenes-dioicae TaxID=796604 RepID=A0A2X0N2U0_9BASI|nr:BQ5605_C004g02774 [Microbotryum silenes-dioicae]
MAPKRSPAKAQAKTKPPHPHPHPHPSSPIASTSTSGSTSTSSPSSLQKCNIPIASPSRTNASDALSLPHFLKLLCSSPRNPLTMSEAISVAKILVPAKLNSPSRLLTLTRTEMARLGIEDEDLRKKLSELTHVGKEKRSKPIRRKRGSDLDRPLPTKDVPNDVVDTDLDFEEILYEEALLKKSCITNRAPVMTAWATVVAERLGFRRQEALSIAQVYTDMNATSKGVSLGIMKDSALDLHIGSSQPFVDIMGRKVPVLSTATGEWRAITKGVVADPQKAFAYVQRAFRQQMGAIVGAMRLLAQSYDPIELNNKGYGLYIEFRPEVKEWGERAELFCTTLLDLRSEVVEQGRAVDSPTPKVEDVLLRQIKVEAADGTTSNLHDAMEPEEEVKLDVTAAAAEEGDKYDKLLDEEDDVDYSALGL